MFTFPTGRPTIATMSLSLDKGESESDNREVAQSMDTLPIIYIHEKLKVTRNKSEETYSDGVRINRMQEASLSSY